MASSESLDPRVCFLLVKWRSQHTPDRVVGGLNEMVHVTCLAQCLTHGVCSVHGRNAERYPNTIDLSARLGWSVKIE